jgi:sterol 3beta-glucosyltransferase
MTQRITIITVGSRGDVQPFVALGMGLQAAGYTVRLATHATFEDFVTSHGLDFASVAGDPHDLITMLASDKAGADLLTFMRQLSTWAGGFFDDALNDMNAACADADMLITGFLGVPAFSIAERRDIPAMIGYLMPQGTPTGAYPGVTAPPLWRTPAVNRLTHYVERIGVGYNMRSKINVWRQDTLGLPPISPFNTFPYGAINGRTVTRLYGYSPHFIPRPPDYPAHAQVTGYWFLQDGQAWEPPAMLTAFLEADEPPIYVGFGSLIDRNAEQLTQNVIRAVRETGNRLLLLSGWAGLKADTLSDDVFVIKSAPHDWLFPRMKAVVHHGGAGTTSAGLRAGVPSVIVPFFGDQPFWAREVHRQGLGAQPVPAAQLTVERLVAAIREATETPAIRDKATRVGAAIRAEDGVAEAVRVVTAVLSGTG